MENALFCHIWDIFGDIQSSFKEYISRSTCATRMVDSAIERVDVTIFTHDNDYVYTHPVFSEKSKTFTGFFDFFRFFFQKIKKTLSR